MKQENGFSMTELLVAMVISGIVMTAIYSAYYSQQRSYETTEAVSDIQQNLRAAMFIMERDIRMAGFDPTGKATIAGFHGVTSDSSSTLKISWDGADGSVPNKVITDPSEYIEYKMEGNALKRKAGASGFLMIANNISGVSFTFLNSSGTTTSNPAFIRSVDILLKASRASRSKVHERDLNTRIYCRNMPL